jgi:hypothetical protein
MNRSNSRFAFCKGPPHAKGLAVELWFRFFDVVPQFGAQLGGRLHGRGAIGMDLVAGEVSHSEANP